MPTINAGSTFTTTIPAGTRFGMGRGTGTYRVGPIGTSASPTIEELIDPEGTWLGPFSGDCSLTVRATTAVTYNTVAPFDALTQTQVVASPETAAALVSGAGISGAQPVLLVGDSNTAFSWDSGPTCTGIVDNGDGTGTISFAGSHNWAVGSRITVNNSTTQRLNAFNALVMAITNTNPYNVTYQLGGRGSPVVSGVAASTGTLHMGRYSPTGYAGWLEALRGRRLGYILAAAGGADSSQALTMLNDSLPEALAAKVSDSILMIGTNDVFARGWDFLTAQASIKALADAQRAALPGRMWWVIPLPMGSGATAWSAGKQAVMNRLIRWMWRYATQIGATPIDSWRAQQNGLTIINSGAANPDPSANFLLADATHTSNLGAIALARAISSEWDKVQANPFGRGFQGGHAAVQNQGNALTNSRLTGTGGTKTAAGGTISGTAPDSWTVEITGGTGTLTLTSPARTVAADGDADGNNLQVVPSVSATTWRLVNTTSLHAAVAAGEVRDAYVPVTITGAAGLTGLELVLFGAKSSGGNENLGFTGVSQAIAGDLSMCLRIPRWVVPAGLTSLSFFVRFTGASAGTITIGKPCLELVE
jgi:hypothetical protein